ncbi:hypothetical protein CU110_00215 [Cobetia sp. ICG0124]|nr:hypothetical protein CU110_00215 [Cobetia sp. ICG0124]
MLHFRHHSCRDESVGPAWRYLQQWSYISLIAQASADVQQASKRDATHERITCYLSRAPFIPAFLADDEWRAVFCLA